jgi:hypothetical protein
MGPERRSRSGVKSGARSRVWCGDRSRSRCQSRRGAWCWGGSRSRRQARSGITSRILSPPGKAKRRAKSRARGGARS